MKVPDSVRARQTALEIRTVTAGGGERGGTGAQGGGGWPCLALANITRDAERIRTFRLPDRESTIPTVMMRAPPFPRKWAAASARGRWELASSGSVPMQTTWIDT